MDLVYARLTGLTASYKVPTILSGSQIGLIVPSYSSLLGMLSYAANREITPEDTHIGFRYRFEGKGMDLEKFHRWQRNKTGSYGYNGTNIRNRETQYFVTLELLLDNLDMYDILRFPYRPLTFGRSQDLATIEEVKKVSAKAVNSGELFGTLLPIDLGQQPPADGIMYNLPEYFSYFDGKVRKPRNIRPFIGLNGYYQTVTTDNLISVSMDGIEPFQIYMHQWLDNE